MNIELKTPKEIRDHAEKVLGLFESTGKKLYKDIYNACQAELQRRAQKKSMEPSENKGQLQRTPIRDAAAKVPQEIKDEVEAWAEKVEGEAVHQNQRQEQTAKAFEPDRRVIARIENPEPLTVLVVEIEFKDAKGNVYTRAMDQTDILTLLKTYFKRVTTSAKMEGKRYSEAYNSDMGKTVYKLFQGWNIIYNETQEGAAWPPLADVFPGLGRASQQQKVNAEILWRWASNNK